jgi:hypothetical protein
MPIEPDGKEESLHDRYQRIREGRDPVPRPCRDLYELVCHGLAGYRSTFVDWCRGAGFNETSARLALYGVTQSPQSQRICASAIRAAGLIDGE